MREPEKPKGALDGWREPAKFFAGALGAVVTALLISYFTNLGAVVSAYPALVDKVDVLATEVSRMQGDINDGMRDRYTEQDARRDLRELKQEIKENRTRIRGVEAR